MRFCSALLVALLCCATARAADAPKARDAQLLLERGASLYREGRYEEAIAAYQQGYEIEPNAAFLYAWAQAERQGGDCPSAITLYERFLREELSPAQRAAAEQNLERCRQEPVVAPASVAPAPPPARTVEARPSPAPPAAVTRPSPADPAPAPVSMYSPWYTDFWGGALSLSGLSAAAVGAGFYMSSLSRQDQTEAGAQGDFPGSYDQHEGELRRARQDRIVGVVGIGVGAALLTAGVVRYLTRAPSPETATLGLSIASDSVAAVGQVTF
jgi:tetratricopeptide (TPR) repeat protein